MIINIGEDNHQEAFDETEGVWKPCQTDGASKRLGNWYHLDDNSDHYDYDDVFDKENQNGSLQSTWRDAKVHKNLHKVKL